MMKQNYWRTPRLFLECRGGAPGQRPDYLQRQTPRGTMPTQGGPLGESL